MRMQDSLPAERPREKLLRDGPAALSDAELLALCLRTGVRGMPVLQLAHRLLRQFGSLGSVLSAPRADFLGIPGLGEAKYAQLMAVRELAQRALAEQLEPGDILDQPAAVREYLRLRIGWRETEVFLVMFLSAHHRVLAVEDMFAGTLCETRVYIREVIRRALQLNAGGMVVAHNHPSGQALASEQDIRLTRALKNALELVDIVLLDHFVVTASHALSFREQGLL